MPDFIVHQHLTPEIYEHIFDAISNGQPDELTYWPMEDRDNPRVDASKVNPNRAQAMAHNVAHFKDMGGNIRTQPAGAGLSWDEYPFASTLEGGTDSSVRAVPEREQRVQGGSLSGFYTQHNMTRGSKFRVVLSPNRLE
ncbi:NucA/NucB deoxyribonuclease domain-containing protein [Aquabacterium sp. A7-Y]|uniref:NucA/NucB deoxyribonuclease domain-containing protein n=1 Tax=Aquabacterium sp. A7-Y TaxID=1349605 RepID=UPI00223CDD24|nr:NucA/NucB deoxyribonuclease domain-containing protein [Aquabacterium sp. A7-Y]MCW7538558.1 NucA/NucB deoxyribonuclease domain-containing protein [Aquabacterium sp. A7-Y]